VASGYSIETLDAPFPRCKYRRLSRNSHSLIAPSIELTSFFERVFQVGLRAQQKAAQASREYSIETILDAAH
jgi:hypothetical protein